MPPHAAFLLCAVCVVIIGFYLFLWHKDEGFHRVFAASILFRLVSMFCGDVSLAPRGEFFHDWNQHRVILQLHSISLLFLPQHCHPFLPSSPQHCSLVFTYSPIQRNKLQLYSLQLRRFSFASLHSYVHRCFSSPHLWCDDGFSLSAQK